VDDQIVAIYCLCDDVLKALDHYEDPQRQMSDAEVMTTALVAAVHFHGHWQRARKLLGTGSYIPAMLGKSRFNRRLHAIGELFLTVFQVRGELFKQLNTHSVYVIDSFPIAAGDNIRIPRAGLYQDEAYRGYTASKRRYFDGLRIHLLVTSTGEPVEVFLAPGADADVRALHRFPFDLPAGSTVYADSAFTHYVVEDLMQEAGIALQPIRKKNSKRPVPPYVAYLQSRGRKIVETTGSLIERLLPKSIHAVSSQGFELKVMLFVLAVSMSHIV
jgi:hypothetical protein